MSRGGGPQFLDDNFQRFACRSVRGFASSYKPEPFFSRCRKKTKTRSDKPGVH
jgi:hypothetical protein